MTGFFITFEGGEGSGKSTQLALLADAFTASGKAFVKTREPGGSPGAEAIRTLLVSGSADAWDPAAETVLFYAARLDHMHKTIKPALAAGKHVICDRFADSTLVYQGIGKGQSEAHVRMLHELLLGNFAPDLTLVLDIDPVKGLERAKARRGNETRFESMDIDFHHRIRNGFLDLARREPERCAVLDAMQNEKTLHGAIIETIKQRLGFVLKAAA